MQGGRKEVQEESSGSDANAPALSLPIEPQDGALSTSCSRKKASLQLRYRNRAKEISFLYILSDV